MALGVILVGEMDTLHGSDTRISPITVMTVVEVVGVRPNGQTSLGAPVNRHTFASAARGLSGLLVITINFMSGTKPLVRSTNSTSSRVFPELEINNMISFLHTIPRSPCCASLGCKEKSRCTGRAKGGSDIQGDLPGFTHSTHDQFST